MGMNLTGRREKYKAFVKDGGGEIRKLWSELEATKVLLPLQRLRAGRGSSWPLAGVSGGGFRSEISGWQKLGKVGTAT